MARMGKGSRKWQKGVNEAKNNKNGLFLRKKG